MNNNNILFCIVLIILFIGIITLFIFTRKPQRLTNNKYPSCDKLLNELPDVDNYERCWTLDGYSNNSRYYDPINNWTIVAINSQIAPNAKQVCGNDMNCLNKISPLNCSDPSVPVAKKNNIYFYVLGRGKINCYPR